ncbi:MAG: pilus assembly protein [Alphaproteobacteria bacterium]|nr:pilus assembly protein [Alphaproteobacteria bacterium]
MRAIARCGRGHALVEFGLVAPALFLAMIGIMEISLILFVTVLMEGGLRQASRFGITGYLPEGTTREEMVIDTVAEAAGGLITIDDAHLTTYVYPSFDDIGKPEPFEDDDDNGIQNGEESYIDINGNGQWDADMGAAGLGGPGSIVLYTINAEWEFMTPLFGLFAGENGKIPLRASLAVRNEPYPEPVEEEGA